MGASFDQLAKTHGAEVLDSAPRTRHIYIDRGSRVLGVAHIDSVQKYHGTVFSRDKIHASTVDDRIGVYMLLHGLPALGINCDVLLTDHEEIGMSTAQYFAPRKEYNWMFSFDRMGADVVCYQYETPKLRGGLEECGFSVGDGIWSDISYMEYMEVCGFNVGCGMHDYHSKAAYVDINELLAQAASFRYFWTFYEGTRFDWSPGEFCGASAQDWYWDDDVQVMGDLTHETCDYCGVWDYSKAMHKYLDSNLCDGCYDWYTHGMIEEVDEEIPF
jgi:hypothetical protein